MEGEREGKVLERVGDAGTSTQPHLGLSPAPQGAQDTFVENQWSPSGSHALQSGCVHWYPEVQGSEGAGCPGFGDHRKHFP